MDDLNDVELTGTERFVAKGNTDALLNAFKGNIDEALNALDAIRDQALEMEQSPELQNEIECRRLETRLHVAESSGDIGFFADVLREIGQSGRFSSERLHENVDLAGSLLNKLVKRAK